jgi:oligopeptide/dipeptide ABC transporter ATP-binding protein
MPAIEVRNLSVCFTSRTGDVYAVDGVSFAVEQGETVGIIGESGCGKSATASAILRLNGRPPETMVDGEVIFEGRDLTKLSELELSEVRGRQIGMVFQDPTASLNPTKTVGSQIAEVLRRHTDLDRNGRRSRAIELLNAARIPEADHALSCYPHELSGGMCQRVMIAIAVSCGPQVLIADEPTTALDVTNQAEILRLLKELQADSGMASVVISHDMAVMAGIADRVAVMYAGQIVELAAAEEIFQNPEHPYTEALLAATPRTGRSLGRGERLTTIPGAPPDLRTPPSGCRFAPRCPYRDLGRCAHERPELRSIHPHHLVRTLHPRSARAEVGPSRAGV